MEPTEIAPKAALEAVEKAGLSIDDVIRGAKAFLPLIELIAKRTPNKFDDAFVTWLKAVLPE